jgi:hypothetical protein
MLIGNTVLKFSPMAQNRFFVGGGGVILPHKLATAPLCTSRSIHRHTCCKKFQMH